MNAPGAQTRARGVAAGSQRLLSSTAAMLAAWRGITPREWMLTAGVGLLLTPVRLTLGLELFTIVKPELHVPRLILVATVLVGSEIGAFSFLVCLVAADSAVSRGAPRSRTYVAAAIAGALIASTLAWASFRFLFWAPYLEPSDAWWLATVWPSEFLRNLTFGAGATWVWADLRRARETQARLNRAELERARLARITLGTQLNAMRARVEPQFLFDTLARVKHGFPGDPTRAGQLLDRLIAYLRGAMPQLHEAHSTVAREVGLARAYLEIMAMSGEHVLSFDIAVADGAGEAHMPPMLLLPLLEVATRLQDGNDNRVVGIVAAMPDGIVRIAVTDTGAAFDPARADEGFAVIAERLQLQHGARGRIVRHRREPAGSEAIVEFPHEPPDSGHR